MLKLMTGPLLTQGRATIIELCAQALRKGERFAYLVPTVQMQREIKTALLSRLRRDRSEVAIFSPDIYLFDGLVNELLKDALEYGAPVESAQQKLILQEVTSELRERGELPTLQVMAEYAGFYQSLYGWLKEIKAAGVSPDEWLRMYGNTGKGRELGLIYRDYENFLTRHDLTDRERSYERLIRLLEQAGQTWPVHLRTLTSIYVDGFYKLDSLHLRLLKAFLQTGIEVVVHTYVEEGRGELFRSTYEMLTELRTLAQATGHQVEEMVVEQAANVDRPRVLDYLSRNLFNLNATAVEGGAELQILHTPDLHEEVTLIGREIKQTLLQDSGLKLDEIAVVFRNLDLYQFYLEEVFTELGIPYELAGGLKLADTPVFKLILKVYRIFQEDWSRESVVEVLKSHYLQLGEQNRMEEYEQLILEAGVIGGRSQWQKKLGYFLHQLQQELEWEAGGGEHGVGRSSGRKVRDLQRKMVATTELMELLNSIFERLTGLAKSQSMAEHCKCLWDLFEAYNVPAQIRTTRDHAVLRRDLLALGKLADILRELGQLGELLRRGRKLPGMEFFSCLQQAAEGVVIPGPEVQYDAVQILTPSRSRGHRFKLVIIGGLQEGQFPWYGSRDWLFTAEERQKLKEQGISFTQFYERMEEERLFFLDAVSTATEKLILTVPVLLTSEAAQSSSFLTEVLNLYHDGTIRRADRIMTAVRRDGEATLPDLTRREFAERLLQAWWQGGIARGTDFTALAETAVSSGDGDVYTHLQELYSRGAMVQLRESAEFSQYDGVVQSPEIQDRLRQAYHPERVYSISQINDFAVCPFQFFCKRILHLDEVEEPVLCLEPLDLGNLYHHILFAFFRDFSGWEAENLEAGLQRIEQIARGQMASYGPGLSLPRGLWAIYQEEIVETLQRLLSYEYDEAARSAYMLQPAYLEASFGLTRELQEEGAENHCEPVVIRSAETGEPDGEMVVKFSGKIDRIDMSKDGRYLIIYDYKLGRRAKGFEELEDGIDVQLPVYIQAAQAICGGGQEVLGAGYFSLNQCKRDSGIWRDLREDLIPVTKRSKSCLSTEDWEARLAEVDRYIVEYVRQIRSGDFKLNPAKCPAYCKFSHICRFEHARNRRKQNSAKTAGGEV